MTVDDQGNVPNSRNVSNCLPQRFRKILQILLCGTSVSPSIIYKSGSNERFALKLSGPWQDLLRNLVHEASEAPISKIFPPRPNLDDIDEYSNALLKLQVASHVDESEDECHELVYRTTSNKIVPRFYTSFTMGPIRATFMEFLEDCTSVRVIRRSLKSGDENIREEMKFTDEMYKKMEDGLKMMWVEAGVMHCDLHPSNVLVSSGGRVYFIDFGMAIKMDDKTREKLKRALEKKSGLPEAFDSACKKKAFNILLKRGYEIEDENDMNDDAEFLRMMQGYCEIGDK